MRFSLFFFYYVSNQIIQDIKYPYEAFHILIKRFFNQEKSSILRKLYIYRKTAAEILGIPLEQSDTEGDIIVVKASVTTPTEVESKVSQRQLRTDQSRNTTVCSVM